MHLSPVIWEELFMPDMLVRLYDLPDHSDLVTKLGSEGVVVRRLLPPERHTLVAWVTEHFNRGWASECERAINNWPVSCFVAIENGFIVGFSCYDATCKGFFGPTGVAETERGRGVGKALLWAALHAMWEVGYGYAIIGGVGPAEFYAKAVGAVLIEGSSPGIYGGVLSG
jgi:GNAT superfamily N-acetyltransferase